MPIGIFAYQASHFETQGWVESRQTAVGNAVDNHLYLHGFGAGVVGHVRGESFTLKIRGVTGSLIRVVVDDVAVTTFSSGSASYIDATVATGSDAWHKVEVKSALNSPGPILSRDTFLRVSGSTPAAAASSPRPSARIRTAYPTTAITPTGSTTISPPRPSRIAARCT